MVDRRYDRIDLDEVRSARDWSIVEVGYLMGFANNGE
jgi:hypothetical protein